VSAVSRRDPALAAVLLAATLLSALPGCLAAQTANADREQALQGALATPRPIQAVQSVWLEELTWMEVRDLLAAGTTTAIIPTGGVEQNGPYVALGKHNYVLETACEWLALELGDAVCAPIVKFVPEGGIEPPTGHMRYPGTISVRDETFEMMLTDIARSLAAHGFTEIVFIGDSGGNQRGMARVAEALNAAGGDVRAHHLPEFYETGPLIAYMNDELGIVETQDDGIHDFYWITVQQMVTDPATVRYDERVAAGLDHINGVSLSPVHDAVEVGRKLIRFRVDRAVEALERARGAG
jgi:hypothetical protein